MQTREGYFVICRAVRYQKKPARCRSTHANHLITTRNVILGLTKTLTVVDEQSLVIDEPPPRQSAVTGLEDCRPFEHRGRRFLLCATGDRHPSGFIHQSLCLVDGDGRVAAHQPLTGSFDDRHQKNWLPFVSRDRVRAVYGYDPLTVLRLDIDNGRYGVDLTAANPFGGRNWRGSGGPVSLPGSRKLLILVHEVLERPNGLLYVHRFVECDRRFNVRRVSRPFVFAHRGIEFACGMTLSHDRRRLIVGLGIEDVSAYLCLVGIDAVERSLSHRSDG
jgi:hypothetical protein